MHARRHFLIVFALFAIAGSFTLGADAQPLLLNAATAATATSPVEPGAPPAPIASPAPSLADKRAQNNEQLRIAMHKLETDGAKDAATSQEVAFYQTRAAVLAQQEAVEQQIKDLEARKAELEARAKKQIASNKVFKFADLDRMKDDLAAEQARSNQLADRITAAKANLQRAQSALNDSEVKSRQAQGDLESGRNSANAADLANAADRAQKNATLAGETLALRKRELDRDQVAGEVSNLAISARQALIARISPQVVFTEADYKEQTDSIARNEETASALLNQAEAGLHSEDLEITKAQQQLQAAAKDSPDRPKLFEALNAHKLKRQWLSEQIDSQTQQLQQLAELRLAWDRRYEIATTNRDDTDHEYWGKLKTYQGDTKVVLDRLADDLRTQISKMRDVRDSLASTTKRADQAAKGPLDVLFQINQQQQQLEETLKIYEKNLVTIETSRRVHEKLLNEVGRTVESVTPKTIALGAWYQAETVWNHELLPINGQSVRVGDAIKGLTILIFGWILSRSTAGMFANRLLKRFRLSKDATSAIRSLVFYSLLLSVALTALNTVGVPLTAFTILGGGLAIGVGFGSQTLVNNFIGGLIMLAERPVRLGERITFGSIDGVVEDVGFRCTKLRTQADHLVTIPNSTLVNESIENIDRRRTVRRTFTLAVTYNITRDLLAEGVQAIRDILEERDIRERIHPIVGFEELSPRVHFTDFSAESLSIQVSYYYAPVDSVAFLEHSERVNFRIMEEFDRLGIDFAFPSKTPYVTNQNRRDRGRGPDSYAA
jgi:small-conductance mechanosensitive channel